MPSHTPDTPQNPTRDRHVSRRRLQVDALRRIGMLLLALREEIVAGRIVPSWPVLPQPDRLTADQAADYIDDRLYLEPWRRRRLSRRTHRSTTPDRT